MEERVAVRESPGRVPLKDAAEEEATYVDSSSCVDMGGYPEFFPGGGPRGISPPTRAVRVPPPVAAYQYGVIADVARRGGRKL
ncbi:hypothetical protein NDU88_010620 [Pleurodeles waltl]|uniref:Uncharacterized protein n=1 Tax=Pleurodeles waltl TaxID=8319 RepID=A0AAV7PYK9_PLEWA|nr:hypothetical protein NDU88_010620 [Pleurodeles waltl]